VCYAGWTVFYKEFRLCWGKILKCDMALKSNMEADKMMMKDMSCVDILPGM